MARNKKSSAIVNYERSQFLADLWGAFRIAAFASAVFSLVYFFVPVSEDPFWRLVRDIILTTCGQVVVLALPVVLFQRTNFARVVSESIKLSFGSDNALFATFSPEMRRDFVGANLKATLGDKTGDAVFDSVVSPLMDAKTTTYRKDFRYIVKCLDAPPPRTAQAKQAVGQLLDALHNTDRYFWMSQCLQYDLRKVGDEDLRPFLGPFELWFAFDDRTLDVAVRRNEIFFREVLKLDPSDLKRLLALQPDELENFPSAVLDLKVEARSSGEIVGCQFEVEVDPGPSPLLRVRIKAISDLKDPNGLRITFNMPQQRDVTRFLVVLPQPTEFPEIEFTRAAHMKNLEPVRFLSRLNPKAVHEIVDGTRVDEKNPAPDDPRHFKLSIRAWTFPTSGVMFFWENR